MAKQNTDQIVGNHFPEAIAVFITLDKEGKPIKDLSTVHTIVPDIGDIQEIQLALGSTGKTGKFMIQINNPNNKYYVKDDMVKEIENLKEGKVLTWVSDKFRKDGTNSQVVAPGTTWESAQDFLNNEVYNRVYTPSAADNTFLYILFQDGEDDTGTPIFKYRRISREEMEAYDHTRESKLKLSAKEEKTTYDTQVLSEEQVKDILAKAKRQSAFFDEFGGQLEHGRCVFEPMQLCIILMSRRFRDKNDLDDMIVSFTGYVDSVSDEFDGKTQVIRVMGSDVTKLMRVTLANINPSIFEPGLPEGGKYRIWGNIFSGMLGWQIIKTLTLGGYDKENFRVHGAGYFEYKPEGSSRNSARENQKKISKVAVINGLQLRRSDVEGETRSKLDNLFFTPGQVHLQVLPFETRPKGVADYAAYKKIFRTSFQNWQNEYRNHLEIANEVAKLTNYEFYADQFGDIWYHQPRFHNYHMLTSNDPEVYVLRDEDIVNHNFSESDDEVVTSVYVMGMPNLIEETPQILKMTGFYEDVSLVRKYGRRYISVHHPYITESVNCFYFAKSILLRLNAGRFVGRVTLLGRPEIRMHMPVYVPMRNMVYYVAGIQHQFKYGGTFSTTLTLKYGHKPWEILPEILDYRIQPNMTAEDISREPVNEVSESDSKENSETKPDPNPYGNTEIDAFDVDYRLSADAPYVHIPPPDEEM